VASLSGAPTQLHRVDAIEKGTRRIPLWTPSREQVARANITRFAAFARDAGAPAVVAGDYPSLYDWSIASPEQFWPAVWRFCGVVADERPGRDPWDVVLVGRDRVAPPHPQLGPRWFTGSRLNFAENLLRYRDDREALVEWTEQGRRRALSGDIGIGDPRINEEAVRAFGEIALSIAPDLRTAMQYFEAEHHMSLPLQGLYQGLLHAFEGFDPPWSEIIEQPSLVAEHFEMVSENLGATFLPPAAFLGQVGSTFLYDRAEFDNASSDLWPGQFVTLQLETGASTDATVVPAHAVQQGLEGPFVYRVHDAIAEVGGASSYSEGEEPDRKVIVRGD
jgi:hypothetical protein